MRFQNLKLFGFVFLTAGAAISLLAFGCSARKSRPTQLRIHPIGWLADHPAVILSNNLQPEYGLGCKSCHGEDYTGGTAEVSCVGCHNQRLDVCVGCHGGYAGDYSGAPPYSLAHDSNFSDRGVGGHPAMVKGSVFFAGTDCQTCHAKPPFVLSSTHFTPSGNGADGRAEVIFSGLPQLYSSRYGAPVFDTASGGCSNIYCHGAFPGGDTARVMNFYGGSGEVFCGSCHVALPGGDFTRLSGQHKKHGSLAIPCITCHYATVDSLNAIEPISRRQMHVNGLFDVEFDPTVAPLGLFDGVSCSGLPDSPGCHANRRDW
jgi:predicted CxxxxCH...CXXCH cytochrome family protein